MISVICDYVPTLLTLLTQSQSKFGGEIIVSVGSVADLEAVRNTFPTVKPLLVQWQKLEPVPPPLYWSHERAWASISACKYEWICFLNSEAGILDLLTIKPTLVAAFENKKYIVKKNTIFYHQTILCSKFFRNFGASYESLILASVPPAHTLIQSTIGLSGILLYCSLEQDLIEDVVSSLDVCDELIIVYMTHFFDGTLDTEARGRIQDLEKRYPNVISLCLDWKPADHQGYWPSTMRKEGFLRSSHEWILFIDSDEVVRDRAQFKLWFGQIKSKPQSTYKLANYWYFLSKKRRAKKLEDSIVLIRRGVVFLEGFNNYASDRDAFVTPQTPRQVLGLDRKPMFDHFSWVRPRDTMLKKVKSWGHRQDRDWVPLVERAFASDLLTTPDFVHNYEYDILD